jgi:hypothetical protein
MDWTDGSRKRQIHVMSGLSQPHSLGNSKVPFKSMLPSGKISLQYEGTKKQPGS